MREGKKIEEDKERSPHHLDVKLESFKILHLPDQDSNLLVCCSVLDASDFRVWAYKWIRLSYAMLIKYHSGMELPQHILVKFH